MAKIESGTIIMWSGATANIPAGWLLCNGSNGTPDLRNRFIVGAGNSYTVGATGGADTVTLQTTQIPSHNHPVGTLSLATSATHTHTYTKAPSVGRTMTPQTSNQIDNTDITLTSSSSGVHNHSISGTSGSTGGGSPHENRPAFMALAYIIKI